MAPVSAAGSLALCGRLIEIAATGQREVSFDLADFYHSESLLFGVDALKRDLVASTKVLDALTPGIIAGDYHAAPVAEMCGWVRCRRPTARSRPAPQAASCRFRRNSGRRQ
jgi:hypothetical protein